MPGISNVLNVFVASPGGLAEERDLVSEIAARLTMSIGQYIDVSINVYKYEFMIGGAGRPQEQINRYLDECDVFVGLMHRAWGNDTGGGYDSGFIEEFERAYARWEREKIPEIALFFKEVDESSVADPGPRLQRILEFRADIQENHKAFYNSYRWPSQFGQRVMQMLVGEMHKIGKTGATGSGYSPTRSGAISLPSGDLDTGTVNLAGVLERLKAYAVGSAAADELDRDRLSLFACALSRDPMPLGVHLANRLFLKRGLLQLITLEKFVWFLAYISDLGGAENPSQQVLPFISLLQGPEDFYQLISDYCGVSLLSDKEKMRSGWLKLASAVFVRPGYLWTLSPIDPSHNERLVSWWNGAFSGSSATHAFHYWMSVGSESDGALVLALESSDGGTASLYASAIGDLYSVDPSAEKLAKIDPNLLLDDLVRELFPNRNLLETVSTETLQGVVLKSQNLVAVRVEGLRVLLSRGVVTSDFIFEVLNEGSSYSALWTEWTRQVEDLILDSKFSKGVLEQIRKGIAQLDSTRRRRHMEIRLQATYSEFTILAPTKTLAEIESDFMDIDGLEFTLASKYGTSDYSMQARQLATGTYEPAVHYLEMAREYKWEEDTLEFASNEFRFAGLQYLAKMPLEKILPSDRALMREMASEPDSLYSFEAAEWLAEIGSSGDLDLLIAHASKNFSKPRKSQLRVLLLKATLKQLRELLSSDVNDVAVSALGELKRRGHQPSMGWLRRNLYHSNAEFRLEALELICEGTDADYQNVLLAEYPVRNGTYFYNVMVALDWRLSGLSSLRRLIQT